MASRLARSKIVAYLEVRGRRYACSQITLTYALNAIPTAQVTLAVGRDMRTLEQADIHDTANQFRYITPAQIYLELDGAWSPEDQGISSGGRWSQAGEQLIFDGYITGLGNQTNRGAGSVAPAVQLIHWLSDLSFSSAISNQSHPGNPARFRWRAVYGSQGVAALQQGSFVADHVSWDLFSPDAIRKDFWKESLFPMFCRLAEKDALDPDLFEDSCKALSRENGDSQKALARFETSQSGHLTVGDDYLKGSSSPYYKPLSILAGTIEEIISSTIGTYCAKQALESFFNTTAWDKLVAGYAPAFAFAVVPKVQTAAVVPYVPGYRTAFDVEFGNGKYLDIQDIESISQISMAMRPLRAVGVIQGGMSDMAGTFMRDFYATLGGCYAPSDAAKGMVLYKRPPPWLEEAPAHAHAGLDNLLSNQPGCATTPRAPGAVRHGGLGGVGPVGAVNKLRDYYAAAARYFYNQEMLRGRSCVIGGKLRFDLAPGTTVRLFNASPLFISNDQLSQDMIGSVTKVSVQLSAQPGFAGTSFQLDHIRTARENEDDATSAVSHPLYSETYSGAPLVDAYLFAE